MGHKVKSGAILDLWPVEDALFKRLAASGHAAEPLSALCVHLAGDVNTAAEPGGVKRLQRLKDQGLRLRRFGFEGESGLGEESADKLGPVLDSREPVLDDGGQVADSGGGEVAQAVFHVRPDTLGGVEVRGVGGQLDDGQPVRMRAGERAHHSTDVGVEVVPDQDDRGMQLLVRGGDQAGLIGFGHTAALALASPVHPHPVEQAAPRLSLEADQPRDRHAPGSLAGHPDHVGAARSGPWVAAGSGPLRPRSR